jgi:non-specific serine/threonine protein kinase
MAVLLGIPGLDAVEPAGSNGFVTSYDARDSALGQDVTVEVLPPLAGNEEALQQFERTLRALNADPRHPGILPIRELGQLGDGRPYVITLRSTTRAIVERAAERPLTSDDVAAVGATLADALAVAHERGVVHGDVRLEHVRLTEEGAPVLGAFGYARLARTLRTARTDVVTSLTNASPELLAGGDPDAAADVWALACCLHQLLVGRSPFGLPGDAPLPEIVERAIHQPLEDLRAAGVADDLATVLEAALQRDRSLRLATAASMRRALRGVGRLHGGPAGAEAEVSELPEVAQAGPGPGPAAPAAPDHLMQWWTSPHEPDAALENEERARVQRRIAGLLVAAAVLLVILAVSILSLLRS